MRWPIWQRTRTRPGATAGSGRHVIEFLGVAMNTSVAKYKRVDVDGFGVAYREAGPVDGAALLLLHGFPTSSHMFRNLIPKLADRYRVVAPDLPGFGQSDLPSHEQFKYTFSNLA